MRHEKTVSVSKIKPVWEPWEEDETPRKLFLFLLKVVSSFPNNELSDVNKTHIDIGKGRSLS